MNTININKAKLQYQIVTIYKTDLKELNYFEDLLFQLDAAQQIEVLNSRILSRRQVALNLGFDDLAKFCDEVLSK